MADLARTADPPPAAPPALLGEPLDADGVQAAVGGALAGAMTAQMIFVGEQLGLYRALKAAGAPVTSAELAAAAGGLSERWVREWLHQQAAARLVEADAAAARFWMTPAQLDALVNEEGPDASPCFAAGTAAGVLALCDRRRQLLESFRTGVGASYDGHGPECAKGVKRELGVWTRHFLVERVASIPGLAERLRAGAAVADVGCGAGLALRLLAAAYPRCRLTGYDISKHALAIARADAAADGLANVAFSDPSEPGGGLPRAPELDFVLVNDALHDMARPDLVLAAIRAALKPDGALLICDIAGRGEPADNIAHHPGAPLFYGFSVTCCLGSALSEPGGLGLGTLGFHRAVAERMCRAAGFARFEALDWPSHMNAYYLVRP